MGTGRDAGRSVSGGVPEKLLLVDLLGFCRSDEPDARETIQKQPRERKMACCYLMIQVEFGGL